MFSLPDTFWTGAIGSVVFGALGIVFLIFGFKLFDWILPKVDFQEAMNSNPIACAIVAASFLFSLAYIIAAVVQ